MSKHTPTPWTAEGKSIWRDTPLQFVAITTTTRGDEVDEANAAFIVRACNARDDLLEACKAVMDAAPNLQVLARPGHGPMLDAYQLVRAAIAKAEED